jgi:short-subunit dehydrogenase
MIKLDVTSDKSVKDALSYLLQRTSGRIDVLLNSAGYAVSGAVEETSIDEAKAQFETNFFGIHRMCKAVLPVMRAQGSGYIINIGSLAAHLVMPYSGFYSATKAALRSITEALRIEVESLPSKPNIKIVLIEPGYISTEFSLHRKLAKQSLNQNSAYKESFEKALMITEDSQKKGSPSLIVAKLVGRIINLPNPLPCYSVGAPKEKIAVFLSKFLPANLLEKGLMRYYGLR